MLAASMLTAPAPRTDCPECALVPRGPCHWDRDGRPRNVHTLPTITSIVPAAGPAHGGTRVTLRGRNLQKAASCRFTLRDGTPLESTPIAPRDADGTEAECSTPVRARPTPEDGLGGVQLVLADGDACAKTGAAKFRFYWYEATSVSPEVGGGGARVEVAMRGLASNGGRVEDVACRFGAHESAAEAIDLSRGVVVCRAPPATPGRLASLELRVSLDRGASWSGSAGGPLRFSLVPSGGVAPASAAAALRAAAVTLHVTAPPPQPSPRGAVLLPGLLQSPAQLDDLAEWLRKLLPDLPALHVLGAAGDEPAFADGVHADAHAAASLLAPLPTQLAALCSRLAAAPGLADGFTLVGLGQGALLARAAVERCDGGPRVGQLLLLDGPQRGTAELPIPAALQPDAIALLRAAGVAFNGSALDGHGTSVEQLLLAADAPPPLARLSVGAYLRPPPHPRGRAERWATSGGARWLLELNGEIEGTREAGAQRRSRMCALDALLVVGSSAHSALVPPRSALFEWYDDGAPPPRQSADPREVAADTLSLRDSRLYRRDWLCLLTLDRASRLYVLDSPDWDRGCHDGRRGCRPLWASTVVPFLNATVEPKEPAAAARTEEVGLVDKGAAGALVPEDPLDEPFWPPSPP